MRPPRGMTVAVRAEDGPEEGASAGMRMELGEAATADEEEELEEDDEEGDGTDASWFSCS